MNDYVKYCLFVEEVGRQLEQRALDGGELPSVLWTRAPGSYSQSKLGVHVTFSPQGRFGPTPHVPAIFPVRTVRVRGEACVKVPEVAAVRLIIAQFDMGVRTIELIGATLFDGRRDGIQDSYTLTLPPQSRGAGHGPRHEFQSTTARMLTRELEVRYRTGVASSLAFARLDGTALRPAEVTRAKTVMWEAFLFEFGISRGLPRPNPRVVKFSQQPELIDQLNGDEAAKYYRPPASR